MHDTSCTVEASTFADRTFEKIKEFHTIHPENLIASPEKIRAAFNFSKPMLFLSKSGYETSLLKEIQKPEDFNIAAYTYLVKNGFPTKADESKIPHKNFDEILDSAIRFLSERKNTQELKEYASIIHLLLLNPKLDLNHKFKLDTSEEYEEPSRTAIEHIFSLWRNAIGYKKEIFADILIHFIAISPDITMITPNAKLNFTYGWLGLFLGYFINEYKSLSNNWYIRQVSPLLGLMLMASSAMTGYFVTLCIIDFFKSCLPSTDRLIIDRDYFNGSFAERILINLKGEELTDRLSDMMDYDSLKSPSYKDLYIKRKLLLQKYCYTKRQILSSASMMKNLQFSSLLSNIGTTYEQLDNIPLEYKAFNKEGSQKFVEVARRIFNEGNFAAILSELACDPEKQLFLLKVYDLIEKGFISLDIKTTYIMAELANYIIYSKIYPENAKTTRPPSRNLSFSVFQEAFDKCMAAQNSEFNQEVDTSESSFNKLDKLWRKKLKDFNDFYEAKSECIETKQETASAKHNTRDIIQNKILPLYAQLTKMHDSLQYMLGRGQLESNTTRLTVQEQNYPITTCLGTLIFGIIAHNVVSSALIIAFAAVAIHFYPKVIDKMNVVQKYCSDGYTWVSSVYRGEETAEGKATGVNR